MFLCHRAARTHLDAPRHSKYFLRRHTPARSRLDLADRFALFGYGPVVHRKPFGPHLTVGALSCPLTPMLVGFGLGQLQPVGDERTSQAFPDPGAHFTVALDTTYPLLSSHFDDS